MITIIAKTPVTISQVEDALIKALRRGLRDIVYAAEGEWQNAAGRHLHRTREQYQKAVKAHKINEDTYEIVLHHPDKKINFLVTAIEAGIPGYDLKPGLLGSESAQRWSRFSRRRGEQKVGAPFLDVPFKTGPARTQDKPSYFRRVHSRSKGWIHPGFRPAGSGGLARPLRDEVKEYIVKTVPDVFGPLLSRMKI